MISAGELAIALSAGAVLIGLSLRPTWFQRIAERVWDALEAFSPGSQGRRLRAVNAPEAWLAGSGALLIVLATAACAMGRL